VVKQIYIKLNENPKKVKLFFIVFYSVGIVGMLLPSLKELFKALIPFALLISILTVAVFHSGKWDLKTVMVFLFIFLSGFFIEVAGVTTGLIFGNYTYGNTLGLQIFDTPLIIGMNWLLLSYVSHTALSNYKTNVFVKVITAAFLMVIYDLVLEQVAPALDMWQWENSGVPLQNYFSWFIISIVFQSLLNVTGINTSNRFAAFIFIVQFLFFLAITIGNLLIH
jgi:putative membrane protein